MCNVFLRREREGAEWPGVIFRGSRKKESCGRQPEAKTRKKRGGLSDSVSLGLLVPSVITSISHSQSFQSCSALS